MRSTPTPHTWSRDPVQPQLLRKPRAELQPHDLCRAALQGDIRLAGWALERHNPDAEAKKGWTLSKRLAGCGHASEKVLITQA